MNRRAMEEKGAGKGVRPLFFEKRGLTPFPALLVLAAAGPAQAQGWESYYTTLDLAHCEERQATPDPDGLPTSPTYLCRNQRAFPFEWHDGDGRIFLSLGLGASREKAAEQTLPPFNTVGKTIEWMVAPGKPGVQGAPYAAVVRYHLAPPEPGGREGQVLVAIRAVQGYGCHIAYVDARANARANELIREAVRADWLDRRDCEQEPRRVGQWQAY